MADLRAEIAGLQKVIARLKADKKPRAATLLTAFAMPLMAGGTGWLTNVNLAAFVHSPALIPAALALICGAMTYHALKVSLPHVRCGIERTLGLERSEARSLAIVFDLAALTGELVLHAGAQDECVYIALGLMVFGLTASVAFNAVGLRPATITA